MEDKICYMCFQMRTTIQVQAAGRWDRLCGGASQECNRESSQERIENLNNLNLETNIWLCENNI